MNANKAGNKSKRASTHAPHHTLGLLSERRQASMPTAKLGQLIIGSPAGSSSATHTPSRPGT